jgi:hypothetical protein
MAVPTLIRVQYFKAKQVSTVRNFTSKHEILGLLYKTFTAVINVLRSKCLMLTLP